MLLFLTPIKFKPVIAFEVPENVKNKFLIDKFPPETVNIPEEKVAGCVTDDISISPMKLVAVKTPNYGL